MLAIQALTERYGVASDRALLLIQELSRPVEELEIPSRPETEHNWKLATLQMWGHLSLLQAEVFLAEFGGAS